MSNIPKLKKQAAEFEQKKQFDRALAKYIQILDALEGAVDEADVALYNRVGDLLLKQGNISQAVDYYERAVDLYTEGGFFNNAIALCNKILRNAPGRNSVYYKLGKISAQKGFVNDAKQNFLEYADRMQAAGQLEEAFRALKEFADLCPDQDDIRLMLADQLVRKDRKSEAIEQLQTLYEKLEAEGRTREARATVDRMKAIDPEVQPRTSTALPTPKTGDLIFLDVNYDAPPSAARGVRTSVPIFPPVEDEEDEKRGRDRGARGPASDLPLIMPDFEEEAEAAEPASGLEHPSLNGSVPGAIPAEAPDALEVTEAATEELDDVAMPPPDAVLDVEVTDEALVIEAELPTLAVPDEAEAPSPEEGSPAYRADEAEPPRVAEDVVETPPLLDEEPEIVLPDLGLITPDEELPPARDESTTAAADDLDFGITREQSAFLDAHEPAPELVEPPPPDPSVFLERLDESLGAAPTADLSFDEPVSDTDLELPDEPAAPAPSLDLADDIEAALDAALDAALEGGADLEPYLDSSGLGATSPSPERRVPSADEPAVDRIRRQLDTEPDNWHLRRSYAEALLEAGERNEGLRELDQVMVGFERWSDFVSSRSVAEEILRVDPNSVKHHQKRVEYAFRAGDKSGLVDAYLQLADCLFRAGQLEKSRAVYQRVLELAPNDARAQEALRAYGKTDLTPPSLEMPRAGGSDTRRRSATPPRTPAYSTPVPGGGDAGFVNLADLLREDEHRKTTRIKVDVKEPGTGEQVDFAEMLHMFKQGVAANMDDGDHQSHYDLGVAYKEMGLLDEAISEFQKALRGTEQRVRTYEALGQCFVEKRQYQIAITILSRALNDKRYSDDMLVGVLYLLGHASEQLERWPDALAYYQRVFAVDIQFRDVGSRLATVERRVR
jgi:tetratricopeptide (TPR) repeat protein